jgi:glycosyltransferase involved in cell wall biosynthesis
VTSRLPERSHLVHVVAGEGEKDLIGPQVIDPTSRQAEALGNDGVARPAMTLLLEPARRVVSRSMRERLRSLRERAGSVRVAAYPVIGRLGIHTNAVPLARWLRSVVGDSQVMFHCRGESAVEWVTALKEHFPGCGIVADIRGAWPEEALHAAGFDGPEDAPPPLIRRYHQHFSRLHAALASAGGILTVSPGMLDWLASLGVRRDRMAYVPCAVAAVQFRQSVREAMRRQLGIEDKTVYAYVGILASYHSIEDGLIRFFRTLADRSAQAHLLCLTTEPAHFRSLLAAGGIDAARTTVMRAAHADVPAYLSAADAGLLLMRPCRLAPTWQPIKYAEYLASGLPVIVSPGVGVVDRQVECERVGIIVDVFGDADIVAAAESTAEVLRRRGEDMRRRALALCEREFVWSRYIDTWRNSYERAFAWGAATAPPSSGSFDA